MTGTMIRIAPWLDRAGIAMTLALPLFLLHGRGVAEALIITVAALFLVRSALARDWTWLRRPWVRLALAWWAWVLLCSGRWGWEATGQAAGTARFLLLVAAGEHWTLREPAVRTWLARLLRWAALYIAAQSLLQFAAGRNLFGFPRSADGELTGPYRNPRAGAPLSRLMFPAVLPVLDRWAGQGSGGWSGGWSGRWRLPALLLLPAAAGTMVLIGQRMPLLLFGLGLVAAGLLLPRLRRFAGIALVGGAVLLAATPVVSPPTFWRLVTKFTAQMEHFPESPYGQIAARAVSIAAAHPLAGVGFDGFRRECPDPAYFGGWPGHDGTGDGRGDGSGAERADGGSAGMCVQHPHNFYLQALVEGGIPGLLLFGALACTWLARLGRGLRRRPDALRAGLFVAALIQLWPLASTTAFTSMPLGGVFFVLLALGLAEAAHGSRSVGTGLVPAGASANIDP